MAHTLTLWTNDPQRAAWADRAGVDRIGIDLETIGKACRQQGLPTWTTSHSLGDLDRLRPVVRRAKLFVRANPLQSSSGEEIEALLALGVDVVMLPNFTRLEEVRDFVTLVRGRARVVPLVERIAATKTIGALAALGIEEIHVGLNDLSIELGCENRLAALAMPILDRIAASAHAAGLKLGVGGLGRALDETLPVPSDLVYAQHARLGATGALLARSFFTADMTEATFREEIERLRGRLSWWTAASPGEIEAARETLARRTVAAGAMRDAAM